MSLDGIRRLLFKAGQEPASREIPRSSSHHCLPQLFYSRSLSLDRKTSNLLNSPTSSSQKDKEDLEELSTELELADEDSLIPYKIGDSFMHVPLAEAQELLATQTAEIDGEVATLEEELETIREQIRGLKAHLYARFGKGINLEA
ncbi:hypothetical protein AYL99_00398 [Fonsecaea erecta]|uniref:Prefoldin subunit 4 n=1 Tax=Fonsecaea erecta TaxID=1367422 RepID=A0A178ZYA7_9EURO|nr:hypothetical protein AYL99_00398 [Fonsecaea erecta]OAP64426.1 hypothetical protein AYL99_00398 [Fonsecaea erecta]